MLLFGPRRLVRGEDLFDSLIERFIHRSMGGIGVEPRDDFSGSLGKGNCCAKTGHQALDLGVIKDHAVRLVTQKPVTPFPIVRGDQVGWDVYQLGFDPAARAKSI